MRRYVTLICSTIYSINLSFAPPKSQTLSRPCGLIAPQEEMKCPYCSAAQGRCAAASSGRLITECTSCGRVVEERQTQSHHLFHLRAQDNPLLLCTSDLPTPPQPPIPPSSDEKDKEEDEDDPFLHSGFITAFSTWSLEYCPVYALSSVSFSGHLAELERAMESSSSSSSSSSNPNSVSGSIPIANGSSSSGGVVVDNLRAYLQIVDVASILRLEHYISDHAFQLFRDCSSATCLRNRSVEALATACLVQAIREAQEPRTLQEISIAANVPQKEIGKYIKILGEALQLSQPINSNSIAVHMPRFCNLLQLNKSAQELATHVGEVVMNKCFCTRRNPISISAAAIYLACQLEDRRKTQAEICKVTGLTEVTLRKVYKELLENWDDLLPKNYTPVVPPEKAFPTTTISSTGRVHKVDPADLPPLDKDRNPENKMNRFNAARAGGGDSQTFQGLRIKKFHSNSQESDQKLGKDVKGGNSMRPKAISNLNVPGSSSATAMKPPFATGSSSYGKIQAFGESKERGNQSGGC